MRKWLNLKGFRGSLFFVMTWGSIGTIVLLTVVWLVYAWIAIGRTVHRDLQAIAARAAGEVDQYMKGRLDSLLTARELLSYPVNDSYREGLMLKRLSIEFSQFKNLSIFDASNNLIASSEPDRNSALTEKVLDTIKKGEVYRSPVLFTKDDLPYITVAMPLFWQGEVRRMLLADIDILHIWEKVDSIRIGETGRVSILSAPSKNGIFIADIDKSRVLKMHTWKEYMPQMPSVENKEGTFDSTDRNGRSLNVSYATVDSMGWILVLSQEHKESMQFMHAMFYSAILIIPIAILAAYYLSSMLSLRISKPVEELHKGVGEITKGNLDYRIPDVEGEEMSALRHHLNGMAEMLSEREKQRIEHAETERMASIGRLAGSVSHEINNPLAIMKNYLFVLSRNKMAADDPNQDYLKILDGEIDRIAGITGEFNKLYKGDMEIVLSEVDISKPLNEVINFCRDDLNMKGITVYARTDHSAKVRGKHDKLKQVFLNLVKNAGEAMPKGGTLTVETILKNDSVSIVFTDTGTGIKQEHKNRLFEPFFTTKGVKGLGLGLPTTYGIVKGFGGDIHVESQEGNGATFTVILPIA